MDHVIPELKILSYLLKQPGKRKFFNAFGYTASNWQQLRDDLLSVAKTSKAAFRRKTAYGDEYEVIGNVQTPNGRMIKLRSGWMIRNNEPGIMYLVTAYPAPLTASPTPS